MELIAKAKSNEFELTPAGTHVATIFKIINLGHVPYEWQGQMKDSHRVRIFWELPNETKTFKDKDGKDVTLPLAISRKFTLSMSDKAALRPFVVGITGSAHDYFNVYELLGKSCLLSIAHEASKDGSKTYATVMSASALPKGMATPVPVNTPVILDVTTLSREEIAALPDYLKKDMEASSEYRLRFLAPRSDQSDPNYPDEDLRPEDIPF